MRHGLVQLTLDVPHHDQLLNWASTSHKSLPGHVTFSEADRRTARETLSFQAGKCVGYQETFTAGAINPGAYVCQLTLASDGLTLTPGSAPTPYVSAAPRDYAYVPPALAASITQTLATPLLTKQQRYTARLNLLQQARTQLAAAPPSSPGSLVAAADATRVAPSVGAARLATERQRLQDATNRLARNNVAVERARLADDSYENEVAVGAKGQRTIVRQTPPPEGWAVKSVTEDKHSGFMAVEYESNFEQPRRKVLAFRGTYTSQQADVTTDLLQGLGRDTDQYRQAQQVAQSMFKMNPKGFDITGHSLGGGEASLAGLLTGQPTYTFNAAGLHANTMLRADLDPNDLSRQQQVIQAYYSDHDPLSLLQDYPLIAKPSLESVLNPLVGPLVNPTIDHPDNLPAAVGIRREFHDGGLHPVVPLVEQIETQKDEDTATIKKFTQSLP